MKEKIKKMDSDVKNILLSFGAFLLVWAFVISTLYLEPFLPI